MPSEGYVLAIALIRRGDKSTREINQETGLSQKYIDQLRWDLKNPGAIKKARARYQARHSSADIDSRASTKESVQAIQQQRYKLRKSR